MGERKDDVARLERKWLVLGATIFGTFMAILDATVVNVALPTMQRVFGADVASMQRVVSFYSLALGIVTPLAGYAGDRFGLKRVYLASLGLFTLGSVLCAAAPNLPLLVAARVVQGLGGGGLVPLGIAFLFAAFPLEQRGAAFGVFGIPLIVAPASGPILGGAFVQYLDWRLIFLINLPIGLAGILCGRAWLPAMPARSAAPFDWRGALASSLAFGCLLSACSEVGAHAWTSAPVLGLLAAGGVALVAFCLVELRGREPVVDLRLFRDRTFALGNVVGWVSLVALFGAEFLLPLYLQELRGQTALRTGLLLLPLALAAGVCSPLSGLLYDRLGARPLLLVGFGLLVANTWQLSHLSLTTPLGAIAAILAFRGVALGISIQPTLNVALSVVQGAAVPRASSLTNASRQVAQAIGVAILATVLQAHLGGFPPNPARAMEGFRAAYQVTFGAAGAAWLLCLLLPTRRPAAVPVGEGAAVGAAKGEESEQ